MKSERQPKETSGLLKKRILRQEGAQPTNVEEERVAMPEKNHHGCGALSQAPTIIVPVQVVHPRSAAADDGK